MTTPTPDEERRQFVRSLFPPRPEPQRPDESDTDYFRRVLFADPDDNNNQENRP